MIAMMTLLYEWEVIAGIGTNEHIGPCGVTDSEAEARRRLTQALEAVPVETSVRGRITIVVLRLDRPEHGYERGRRVAMARRDPRGPVRWVKVRSTTAPAVCW
jgi:hypothetical protein